MRTALEARSVVVWTFASAAKRGSPPGTSDCSGSQYFTVLVLLDVLMPESARAPPMASAALFTRLCSLVAVAHESRTNAPESATSAYLMVPPPLGVGRRRTLLRKSYSR